MWKILTVCASIYLHLVSATPGRVSDFDASTYFTHPKDIRSNASLSPRIVGGDEVIPHSYPSQVGLYVYKGASGFFCGGSLISKQWVLTVAYCVSMTPDYVLVVIGGHDLNKVDPPVVVLKSTTTVFHSEYDGDTFQNDVGLVKLPQEVEFSENIKPAILASGSDRYAGDNGTIVGWGATEKEEMSYVLRKVDATVMTNDACADVSNAYKEVIRPMHLCTSGEGIVGSCGGDSGGPLFVDGVQVGIVSFGMSDCTLGTPSVFTRVTDFHDWIEDHIKDGAMGSDS